MANQLTSSGLTVGSGTITNFIPAFGSNVISNGLVGGGSSDRTPLFVKGGSINGYLFNNRRTKGGLQNHSSDKCVRDLSYRDGDSGEPLRERPHFPRNLGYRPSQWQLSIYRKYLPRTYRCFSCNPSIIASLSKEVA